MISSKYQFITLILSLASFLNQSVTFSHLLLRSRVNVPLPPSSKFIDMIFVPLIRQYLLKSSIILDDQPFRILIWTLSESEGSFDYCFSFFMVYFFMSFGFYSGFEGTGFFFIMLTAPELFSLLFSLYRFSSYIFLTIYSLLNSCDLDSEIFDKV